MPKHTSPASASVLGVRARNPLPQLVPQRVLQIKAHVERLVWERVVDLKVYGGPINDEPCDVTRAAATAWSRVFPGSYFGPPHGGWKQRWFKVDVPAAAPDERGRRFVRWDCDGETTAYHRGEPWAGLDIAHRLCLAPDDTATLWLDCSTWQTGIWLPGSGLASGRISPYGLRFDGCSLRVRNLEAWNVSTDLDVLIQLMQLLFARDHVTMAGVIGHAPPLDSCSPVLRLLLRGLDDACDAFAAGELPAFGAALRALLARLPAEAWQPAAALCGHAHLDLVWLWPEMATERKGVHTFATQLQLMERYPELVFVQSQPALYRAIERRAPGLAKRARKLARTGRWEVLGGFEVEPDTNLPSGEALARSLVYGQRAIRDWRGQPSPVCWIPDVFGYASCLPQILRLGGVRYFFTTKMTWSAVTKFPYNSFVWRGSDGSEVLAHLCPTGYNGVVALDDVVNAARAHRQADVHPEVLLPTGFGDGGGGVTEDMCERARRLANLAGVPRARWTTAEAFFQRLEDVRNRLPEYQGELYLEYHRGTYTTQSELKRRYRAAETALQAHEAARVARGGRALDERAWLRVLFAQFHDALPGSSIALVCEQLNTELAEIAERGLSAAAAELAAPRAGGRPCAFNPLPIGRTAVVESGQPNRLAMVKLPALGSVRIPATARRRSRTGASEPTVRSSTTLLDNGIVRAAFDRHGQLSGLTVAGTPLALDGTAGFVLHHDLPANFDAWDIDHYSVASGQRMAGDLRLEVAEDAPLRGVLRAQAAIGKQSTLTVSYILEAGARHLRIDAQVDWHESHRLLKYYVPTQYHGRWAIYGCPFGAIRRPQQPGTPAEEAMWEVPGSRWAAVVDDSGAGLAVCTEAKYGFSCRDGTLGVSLLRSPKMPDPTADIGTHRLRFAVGQYEARSTADGPSTAAAADSLFAPVITVPAGAPMPAPFALDDLGSLVASWVKPVETGRGFVLRLHETGGASGTARIRLAQAPQTVDFVDFHEEHMAPAPRIDQRTFAIPYRAYQILSLRVRAARAR